jgi:hypothetical protein
MTKSFPWQKAAAIAAVGGFAFMILPSLLGGKKEGEGSESGGFQIPDFFPSSPGTTAAPTGNTYNISFPDFGGFPSDTGAVTKKETAMQTVSVLGRNSSGGFTAVPQSVPVYPGVNSGATLASGIAQVSPAMMTPVYGNPAALKKTATPVYSSGSGSSSKSTGGMGTVTGTPTIKKTSVPAPVIKTQFSSVRAW